MSLFLLEKFDFQVSIYNNSVINFIVRCGDNDAENVPFKNSPFEIKMFSFARKKFSKNVMMCTHRALIC